MWDVTADERDEIASELKLSKFTVKAAVHKINKALMDNYMNEISLRTQNITFNSIEYELHDYFQPNVYKLAEKSLLTRKDSILNKMNDLQGEARVVYLVNQLFDPFWASMWRSIKLDQEWMNIINQGILSFNLCIQLGCIPPSQVVEAILLGKGAGFFNDLANLFTMDDLFRRNVLQRAISRIAETIVNYRNEL